MITLEKIKEFAIINNACNRSLIPFCNFLKEGNELECWRIVLANYNWLAVYGLKINFIDVCKKAEYLSKMYFIDDVKCSKTIMYDKKGRIHGTVIEYYFDGAVNTISYYNKGIIVSSVTYFGNGKVASQLNYKKGLLHGKMSNYYLNGNLKEYCNYDNGMLHGKCGTFYEDGSTKTKLNYIKNNVDGLFVGYHNNGNFKFKMYYDCGIQTKYFGYKNNKIVERRIHQYDYVG